MAYRPAPIGAVLEPEGTNTTSLVPQYTMEEQDAVSVGGTAVTGSVYTGNGFSTSIANPPAMSSTGNTGSTITFSLANAALVCPGMTVTGPGVSGIAVSLVNYGTGVVTLASGTPTGGSYTFIIPGGGLTITQLTASTSFQWTLASTSGGPVSSSYFAGGTGTGYQYLIIGGITLTYQPTSSGAVNGLVAVTNSATVTSGTGIRFPLIIPEVFAGASIMRGDGGTLGSTDWATLLTNTENDLAGLIPQGTGWVYPNYTDGFYGGLSWNVASGSGITPVATGSPTPINAGEQGTASITAVSGNGTTVTFTASNTYIPGQTVTLAGLGGGFSGLVGTQTVASATGSSFTVTNATTGATTTGTATVPTQGYPSSVLVTSAATTVSDNRTFRRVLLFFQKQTNGSNITFATTGVVRSSGALATAGSGLCVWDSGDLGYANAGTGFTATWSSNGGTNAGVILVGALYIQSAGTNGLVNVNISKGGTSTADWATSSSGYIALMELLVTMGMVPRRVYSGDIACNDMLYSLNGASTAQTNLATVYGNFTTASPLTQQVVIGTYNLGTVSVPGVGNATWGATWIAMLRQVAINAGAMFIDWWAALGDLSYLGDAYGLTVDYLHAGTQSTSRSGRNGQQTLSDLMFAKLQTSKDYAISGTTQSGTASDGKIVTTLGGGYSGTIIGPDTAWYKNANDANPFVTLGATAANFGVVGLSVGPGGSTAPDSELLRQAAGVWKVNNAISLNGLTGATSASRYVGATASGPPASGTFSTGDYIIDLTGTVWICTSGGTSGTWNRPGEAISTYTANNQIFPITTQIANWTPTGTATPTIATSGAVDGQKMIIRVLAPFTISSWTNCTSTINVTLPANSTGATTSKPLVVGFIYNASGTPSWQCVAVA